MKKILIMALVVLMAACSSKSKEGIGTATEGERRALKAVSELSVNVAALPLDKVSGVLSTIISNNPQSFSVEKSLQLGFDKSIGDNGQFNYTQFDSANGFNYLQQASGTLAMLNGNNHSSEATGGIQFLLVNFPTNFTSFPPNIKYTAAFYHLPYGHSIMATEDSFLVKDSNGGDVNNLSKVQLGTQDSLCHINLSYQVTDHNVELLVTVDACPFTLSARDNDDVYQFSGTIPSFKLSTGDGDDGFVLSGPSVNIEGPLYNALGERIGFFKLDQSNGQVVLLDNNNVPF